MRLVKLKTHNFRNLKNKKLNFEYKNIFLLGDNGQGKTNFIEAVYLTCYGSSFRTHQKTRLIAKTAEESLVEGTFNNQGREQNITAVKLATNGKNQIFYNTNRLTDRKELILANPCIVFAYDDLFFVNGSPKYKRRFFNQTMSLIDILFLDSLKKYNRLLKNRNAVLKSRDYKLLPVYNRQLAEAGILLQSERMHIINQFSLLFSEIFDKISPHNGSVMRIKYRPSWANLTTVSEAEHRLNRTMDYDKQLGFTTSGPHRDDAGFYLDEIDYVKYASTGQTRLLSLILKLCQALFFYRLKQKKPILLLDDVLLELDPQKKQAFLANLPEYSQAFFTFLPDEKYVNFIDTGTKLYLVKDGDITEWNG